MGHWLWPMQMLRRTHTRRLLPGRIRVLKCIDSRDRVVPGLSPMGKHRRLHAGTPVSGFPGLGLKAGQIPQLWTQCANACQEAVGPTKRVICPINIRKALPHIVAR